MASVKQDYIIGQEFQLCSHTQLSTADNEWKWERRTLSGFITEDGSFIEPAGLTSFDTQEANVSGVWTMNKGRLVELCCLGQSGSISVTFTERSIEAPLADASNPYEKSTTLSSSGSFDTYKWTDIVAHIDVAQGTRIKSISAYQWPSQNGGNPQIISIDNSTTDISSIFLRVVEATEWYWDYSNKPFGISVDFTNQGVLTYIPNKTYVNQ